MVVPGRMAVTSPFTLGLMLLLVFALDARVSTAIGEQHNTVDQNGRKTWCIAKPSTDDGSLINNIHFSCSQPGVDCGVLQKGWACNLPDTLINHASVAMNLYYQAYGRNPWNCHFGNSGLLAFTNPSYGSCVYA